MTMANGEARRSHGASGLRVYGLFRETGECCGTFICFNARRSQPGRERPIGRIRQFV